MKKIALSLAVLFTLAITSSTLYAHEGEGKKKEKTAKCCKKSNKKAKSCCSMKGEKGEACVKKKEANKKKEASK